ncbi:YHYH protein [Aquimarina pacifica]|uniref:YHYH protein n=1 Tax=Aquimarina pacifica TaxID=1296415 RepID=UPI00047155D2|nr:YHYH protein [Aquimarina pacifica]
MRDLNKVKYIVLLLLSMIAVGSCNSDDSGTNEEEAVGDEDVDGDGDGDGEVADCETRDDYNLVNGPGVCSVDLDISNLFTMVEENGNRVITANNIPEHEVGVFNNADVSAQDETYTITLTPEVANELTSLQGDTGPEFRFGVLLNGVELDPIAAEPWPHSDLGIMDPDVNWDWNLEALNIGIGLDCNYSHVQPTGQYHSHGAPALYDKIANATGDEMVLVGYAADGFPLYYKYAYETASDNTSSIVAMSSSYRQKTGNRPGDGETAPCSEYDGAYSADYEYIEDLGTLDEANGRTGVTPEYPDGTYYYILTDGDEFPSIPRYFRGTPSVDFAQGGGQGGAP